MNTNVPGRGDCFRAGGAAEMAVRDYKRALEVEPNNWMVKTRLSLAHYLKVRNWCETLLLCAVEITRTPLSHVDYVYSMSRQTIRKELVCFGLTSSRPRARR